MGLIMSVCIFLSYVAINTFKIILASIRTRKYERIKLVKVKNWKGELKLA